MATPLLSVLPGVVAHVRRVSCVLLSAGRAFVRGRSTDVSMAPCRVFWKRDSSAGSEGPSVRDTSSRSVSPNSGTGAGIAASSSIAAMTSRIDPPRRPNPLSQDRTRLVERMTASGPRVFLMDCMASCIDFTWNVRTFMPSSWYHRLRCRAAPFPSLANEPRFPPRSNPGWGQNAIYGPSISADVVAVKVSTK